MRLVPRARWARQRNLGDRDGGPAAGPGFGGDESFARLLQRQHPRPGSPFLRVMPQQDRARRTIDRLLDAVTAMLGSAPSVERLTLEDAAARAGVTQQSAYRYFASVGDLVRAAIRRMQLDWHARFLAFMTSRRIETEVDLANAAVAFIADAGDAQFAASPRLKQELLLRYHDLDYDMIWAIAEAVVAALPPEGPDIEPARMAAGLTSLVAIAKSLMLRDGAELRDPHVQLMMMDILVAAIAGPLRLDTDHGGDA